MSAFWILSANSWMQTPTGHEVRNGIAYPVDWFAIVFNPSFPYRFAHMLNAAYLTTGFVVLAVGARYLLAGKHVEDAKVMMRMGIGLMAILAPLQLFIGDQHWSQHAQASADQGCGDGRPLGRIEAGRLPYLCVAGREGGAQLVRNFHPAWLVADPDA